MVANVVLSVGGEGLYPQPLGGGGLSAFFLVPCSPYQLFHYAKTIKSNGKDKFLSRLGTWLSGVRACYASMMFEPPEPT